MKVVLDTNVLLVSISGNSKFHPIFQSFQRGDYKLCITTEILLEYEEVISKHMGKKITNSILQLIEIAPNVEFLTTYFKWNLINKDKDDNKFVDCALSAQADFIVTEDNHFKVLETIPFPQQKLISAKQFMKLLNETS